VAAVALRAGLDLVGPSFERVRDDGREEFRWFAYLAVGAVAAALVGAYLVLDLLACGAIELLLHRRRTTALGFHGAPPALLAAATGSGGIGALAWTAFKVGALSFGGGFVIVPLMQKSAVETYHWMTGAEFLNAVALGQVTPGPVTGTIAAVGYAAHGVGGALLAATVAFVPSFSFVRLGGGRFERLRANRNARGFLDGAGPAAIGAILGATVPLAAALSEDWQAAVLAAAAISLLSLRRGVVETLLGASAIGVALVLTGAPVP
jgi:chromate transporter